MPPVGVCRAQVNPGSLVGIDNSTSIAMKLTRRIVTLFPLLLLAAPALPCTAFLICGKDLVFLGNNEDFWDPRTRIWFVPAEEERLGHVYLGYENLFPQGGMNEAGLCFDGFATARNPLKKQEGKESFSGNLIDEAMATCSTVEEVIRLFERHDLSILENAMLMFADQTGDSVIIEGDEFVRKEGSFQVVTNFYQSRQENDRAMCPRYARAAEILEAAPEVSLALCRRALAATAQEAGARTQYSNVFDLRKGLIYLYHFHNFEEVVVFDLREELNKGASNLAIPDLFPETLAYRSYLEEREREIEQAIRKRRGAAVKTELLDEYAGRYSIQRPGLPEVVVVLRRDGQRLIASAVGNSPGGEEKEVELIPESETVFFHIDLEGTREIRFTRGDSGEVDGAVLTTRNQRYRAKRIAEEEKRIW